jgi:hypothetical protein
VKLAGLCLSTSCWIKLALTWLQPGCVHLVTLLVLLPEACFLLSWGHGEKGVVMSLEGTGSWEGLPQIPTPELSVSSWQWARKDLTLCSWWKKRAMNHILEILTLFPLLPYPLPDFWHPMCGFHPPALFIWHA